MMGRKTEPFRNGDEMDALTRAKANYCFRPGTRAAIKARFNRRVRRKAKLSIESVPVSGPIRA